MRPADAHLGPHTKRIILSGSPIDLLRDHGGSRGSDTGGGGGGPGGVPTSGFKRKTEINLVDDQPPMKLVPTKPSPPRPAPPHSAPHHTTPQQLYPELRHILSRLNHQPLASPPTCHPSLPKRARRW